MINLLINKYILTLQAGDLIARCKTVNPVRISLALIDWDYQPRLNTNMLFHDFELMADQDPRDRWHPNNSLAGFIIDAINAIQHTSISMRKLRAVFIT